MKIKSLFILFALLSLFAYKNEKKATSGVSETLEEVVPVINIERAMRNLSNRKMNFSEFVDDITYVPLETNDNSIVGGRFEPPIFVSENHIFYGEAMFKRDGRFVRKFGKIGQGPGEYTMALGMVYDEDRQEIYVYGNGTYDIYVYDFDNRFKRQVKPKTDFGGSISALGNGKVILSRDMSKLFNDFSEYKVIDTEDGEVLYSRVTKDSEVRNLRNPVWRHDGKISYYEGTTDTIFSLKENGEIEKPRFIINMGRYKYKYPGEANMATITSIVESGQYLFFSISKHEAGLYYGAYNKQTGETAVNKFDEFFNNDIDGSFLWLFRGTMLGNEGFGKVFPYIAKERIESLSVRNSGYDKEKNQKLRQLIDKVDEEDNHIFYFFKLK